MFRELLVVFFRVEADHLLLEWVENPGFILSGSDTCSLLEDKRAFSCGRMRFAFCKGKGKS